MGRAHWRLCVLDVHTGEQAGCCERGGEHAVRGKSSAVTTGGQHCITVFFVSGLRIALRAARPHLCFYSQSLSLGRLLADRSVVHSLVKQFQFNRMCGPLGFDVFLLCMRPGRLLLCFLVLPVVRPLACLTHNVSGICARAETAAGSAAGGCAAAFAGEGCGAICCCWFVFCCFGCGGGPKDIHHHKSGRVQGANFPLFGRPLDPGRIGFGVHLGVPQASAGSEPAPADTLADMQIGLQMMLQVFVIRTVSTRHGTTMDTQLLTEPLNNSRTVAR